MSSKQVLLGLVPWMLYALLTIPEGRPAGLVAAAAATACAAAWIVVALVQRRTPRSLDLCAFAVFAAFTLAEALGGDNARTIVDDQGRGLATAALAALMLLSALSRPFTEQYARSDVPATYRSSPVFRSVHRDLSIRWGCTIAFVAVSYLIEADVRAAQGSDVLALVLTWILPVGAVALAARQNRATAVGGKAAAAAAGTWPESNMKFFRSGTP